MSVLVFDYNKKTKQINQMIKKLFGASCNCFFAYDLENKIYRLTFCNTYKVDKKVIPSQSVISELNHMFFDNLNGTIIKDDADVENIKIYCIQQLNGFDTRKLLLLSLFDMFIKEFNMPYGGALSEVSNWQRYLLTTIRKSKNEITLCLDYDNLMDDINMKNNPLQKMASGVEIHKNKSGFKYVELDLDLSTLPTTIRLYSNW